MLDSFEPKGSHKEIAQSLFPSSEECIFITACTQNELFERGQTFSSFHISAHQFKCSFCQNLVSERRAGETTPAESSECLSVSLRNSAGGPTSS